MSSDSRKLALGDIVDITSSKRIFRREYVKSGVPFYRGKEIIEKSSGNEPSTDIFITEERFEEIKKKHGVPQPREILLTSVGTLGVPYQVQDGEKFYFKDGNLTWIKDFSEEVLPEFILVWLKSPKADEQIRKITIGSTQQALTITSLKTLELDLPTKEEQRLICDHYFTLSDKIELNRQTNETLEAMAQAIFKSWFVDFDPVRAKIEATSAGRDPNRAAMAAISACTKVSADGAVLWEETEAALQQKLDRMSADQRTQLRQTAELFPGELVKSEIGEVPKGWEYDQLGNFITVKRGGSPRPIKDFVVEEGLHWTKISDATSENSPFIMTTKEFIKEDGLKKTVLLEKGSLILSNSATPGLPKFLNIDACIHDGWLYFPEQEHFTDLYLYHLFIEIRKALVAKGSGTVFTNLKTSILRNYDVVVPNGELVIKFTEVAHSIFDSLLNNREETESLTKLRDTLLPKLISGEFEL